MGVEQAACARKRRSIARHYHVIESAMGQPEGYRDDVFSSRREAETSARERAEWLAVIAGLHVEPLLGGSRFLITTRRSQDAGRLIEVEECAESDCLERTYGSME